ncbi:MAG: hypothetical protein WD928_07920 [Gammaproteobacteria bacterium]
MTRDSINQAPRRGPLQRLGTLRILLLTSTLVVIAAAPFADGSVHMHDWRLLPGVVAPTIMMMLVFALPLDMTMARVFMSDASAAERARLRFAIRVEACAFVAMLAAWMPFMLRVLDY